MSATNQSNPKQTILLTGASGFVGRELCDHFLQNGFSVRTFLRNKEQQQLFPNHKNLQHRFGTLQDSESLKIACEDIDIVVHSAATAHVSSSNETQFSAINVEGTRNLLEASVDKKVKRLVFISSALAQDAEQGKGDITEYGHSKLAAEQLLKEAFLKEKIDVVILRPVNVYGPGMRGNLSSMISMIDRGLLPPLPKIDATISLVSVQDLAQAVLLSAVSDFSSGKTYIVTDGSDYSISSIELSIYRAFGKKKASWHAPHFAFYTAAASAGCIYGVLNWLNSQLAKLLSRNETQKPVGSINLRTYHNLVRSNQFSNIEICRDLGFQPQYTFESSLEGILANRPKNEKQA